MAEGEAKRRAKSEFSTVSAVGALGGLALLAAFVSPLYEVDRGIAGDPVVEATQELEGALRAIREGRGGGHPELEAFAPIVEPATAHAAAFLATPSPKNLALLAGDARELVQVVALIEDTAASEVEVMRAALLGLMVALLSMPVVGAYHAVWAMATKCRRHGTIALVLSFFAGLFYLGVGAAFIVGAPEGSRGQLGSACWLLTAGGALVLITGIFGVSRQTWWRAYLLDGVGLVALVYAVVTLANERL